jgi:hypothetical protein
MHSKEFAGKKKNVKFFTFLLRYKFGLIFMGMKQKEIKLADSKKLSFSILLILNIFS